MLMKGVFRLLDSKRRRKDYVSDDILKPSFSQQGRISFL